MGEVYEALDLELGEHVALKTIRQRIASDASVLKRFKKEVQRMTKKPPGARPDVSAVARELGLSDRTLQRRIDDDGMTFCKLLLEARQELAREYLNRPDIDVAEVAYLLGYEDSNSFYRAFRTWEGTTPSQLRAELKRC